MDETNRSTYLCTPSGWLFSALPQKAFVSFILYYFFAFHKRNAKIGAGCFYCVWIKFPRLKRWKSAYKHTIKVLHYCVFRFYAAVIFCCTFPEVAFAGS